MGQTDKTAAAAIKAAPAQHNPYEWLMIYSIEHNGGIDDAWLERSGMGRGQAESLLAANPEMRKEARSLIKIGRLFSLKMMFDLLRQRAAEMLAAATKATDLKSLLGTLNMLQAVEQRQYKQQQLATAAAGAAGGKGR